MRYIGVLYASIRALIIATLANGVGSAQAQGPLDPETAAWDAARAGGTAEAYQRYLELYPVGRYASAAFRCIVELSIDPNSPECAPNPEMPALVAPGAGPY